MNNWLQCLIETHQGQWLIEYCEGHEDEISDIFEVCTNNSSEIAVSKYAVAYPVKLPTEDQVDLRKAIRSKWIKDNFKISELLEKTKDELLNSRSGREQITEFVDCLMSSFRPYYPKQQVLASISDNSMCIEVTITAFDYAEAIIQGYSSASYNTLFQSLTTDLNKR